MQLWITGADGLVGTALVQCALKLAACEHIFAFTHQETFHPEEMAVGRSKVSWSALDISNEDAVMAAIRPHASHVVINLAAMTDVDRCERFPQDAFQVNSNGARYLAQACCRTNAHFIHVSTDYVFSGDQDDPGPYNEDHLPHPINVYGQTKRAGECAIEEICAHRSPYTIVRTSTIYSGLPTRRLNFVTWLIHELTAKRSVNIAQDQFTTPTLAEDFASVLLWLAMERLAGTYHASGPDFVSRQDWAQVVITRFHLDPQFVQYVPLSQVAGLAPRPLLCGVYSSSARFTHDAPALRGVASGLDELNKVIPKFDQFKSEEV